MTNRRTMKDEELHSRTRAEEISFGIYSSRLRPTYDNNENESPLTIRQLEFTPAAILVWPCLWPLQSFISL